MMVLSYSITSCTFIIGIVKGWSSFIVLPLIFLSCFLVHKGYEMWKRRNSVGGSIWNQAPLYVRQIQKERENIESEEIDEEATKDTAVNGKTKEGNFFSIKAAVIGLWIPCVVGKTDYTFKLISLTSFAARTFVLIIAFICAICNFVPSGSFLIYCAPHLENPSCSSFTECFSNTTHNATIQKTRMCENTITDAVFLTFFISTLALGFLSAVGSYVLCKLSEYDYMFDTSKTCCWILTCPLFPCCLTSALSPIIHRNLIFTVLDKYEDEEGSKKLQDILHEASKNKEILATLVSRPLQGKTPIVSSVNENMPKCASLLLSSGAKIEENISGEHLIDIAFGNGNLEMVNVLLQNGFEIKENKLGTIHTVVNQALVQSVLENSDLEERKLKVLNNLRTGENSIPAENISPDNLDKVQKLVQEWNADHNEMQVEIGQRKLSAKDGTMLTVSTSSTDKDISQGGEKTITAVEIKFTNSSIHNTRIKYGEDWGKWHKTSYKYDGEEKTSVFTLQEGELIREVKTGYNSVSGDLTYLCLETSAGRKWEQETGSGALRGTMRGDYSAPGKRLGYVSTAQGEDTIHQTVFHWL